MKKSSEKSNATNEALELACPEDCPMCSGEYCERHFDRPCGCDVVDRHRPEARKPGRWTREEAREHGRRGGIARWAVKPQEDDVDEGLPTPSSAA